MAFLQYGSKEIRGYSESLAEYESIACSFQKKPIVYHAIRIAASLPNQGKRFFCSYLAVRPHLECCLVLSTTDQEGCGQIGVTNNQRL